MRAEARGYNQFGGKHHETAALRNVLAHGGVVAPHTEQPFTEALLFGIAGGIAAAHAVFTIAYQPCFIPIWRNMGHFALTVADKLRLTIHLSETTSGRLSETALKQFLAGGDPVMVWGDMASMPYHALPAEWVRFFRHVFVVYGYDEDADKIMVADRACVPLTITHTQLHASRSAIGYFKRRLAVIEPPDEVVGLEQAALDGMRVVCQNMIAPHGRRSGLKGLEQWAAMLVGRKSKLAWPQLFTAPALLFDSLQSVYYFGEMRGTGGGAFRQMYADFLDEAAVITARPGLHDVADLYRECAAAWTALAEAALSDDIALLGEARGLIAERTTLYEAHGQAALEQMNRITDQLWEIRTALERNNQPSQPEVDALLANLREHVLRVHRAEQEAVELLALLVGW